MSHRILCIYNFKKQRQNVTKKASSQGYMCFIWTNSTVILICSVSSQTNYSISVSVITKQLVHYIIHTHQSLSHNSVHAQLLFIYRSINSDCEFGFVCLHSAQLYYTAHYIPNYLTFSIQAPVQELALYFIQMEGVGCQ